MKTLLRSLLLISFLAGSIYAGMLQKIPANFCTADNKDGALLCICTKLHPDICMSEDPMPLCCRTQESPTKAKGCGCCARKK